MGYSLPLRLVFLVLILFLLEAVIQNNRFITHLPVGSSLDSNILLPVSSMSSSAAFTASAVARDRMKGALFGMFVGDAVAMPVHWMYNLRDLKSDYGEIRGYVAPKEKLRNSILSLSNTGGAGRGSSEGDVIGSVINHVRLMCILLGVW
jgi:hypothetical protein